MANYTKLNYFDVKKISEQFDLGEITDFRSMGGGSANSSFIVNSDKGKFVLSLCDEKIFNEVKSLAELLRYLEKKKFPTTRVIRSKNGNFVESYEDKPILIKRFIEGNTSRELDISMLSLLGRTIGKLHQISAPKYIPQSFPYGVDYFSEVISLKPSHSFSIWLKDKQISIKESIYPQLPRGLIHGDVFYDNVLFSKNNVSIIDFEEASNYYNIFDLGMCLVGTCNQEESISFEKARSLIDGYQKERELNQYERESLQLFAEYSATATAFWRFRQYNLLKPNNLRAESYKEMQNLADKISTIPNDQFIKEIF